MIFFFSYRLHVVQVGCLVSSDLFGYILLLPLTLCACWHTKLAETTTKKEHQCGSELTRRPTCKAARQREVNDDVLAARRSLLASWLLLIGSGRAAL